MVDVLGFGWIWLVLLYSLVDEIGGVLFFTVLDNGGTFLTHLLPMGLAGASVLGSAFWFGLQAG